MTLDSVNTSGTDRCGDNGVVEKVPNPSSALQSASRAVIKRGASSDWLQNGNYAARSDDGNMLELDLRDGSQERSRLVWRKPQCY